MFLRRRKKVDSFTEIVKDNYERRLRSQLANPDRLRAVYSSRFWQNPPTEKLREFCNAASHVLETPVSRVTLVTDTEQKTVAAFRGEHEGLADEVGLSLCQHVIGIGTELPIEHLDSVPYCNIPKVATDSKFQAYLGVPLINRKGYIIGAFCVIDYVPREWTPDDITVMVHLADAIMLMREVHEV